MNFAVCGTGPLCASDDKTRSAAGEIPRLDAASNTIYLSLRTDLTSIDPSLANPYGTADHYVVNRLVTSFW